MAAKKVSIRADLTEVQWDALRQLLTTPIAGQVGLTIWHILQDGSTVGPAVVRCRGIRCTWWTNDPGAQPRCYTAPYCCNPPDAETEQPGWSGEDLPWCPKFERAPRIDVDDLYRDACEELARYLRIRFDETPTCPGEWREAFAELRTMYQERFPGERLPLWALQVLYIGEAP